LKQKEKVLETISQIKQLNNTSYGKIWSCLGKAYFALLETSRAIEDFKFVQLLGYCTQYNYLNPIIKYQSIKYFVGSLTEIKKYLRLFQQHYIANILAVIICSYVVKWKEELVYINAALEVVSKMNSIFLYKSYFFLNLGD
jgi:hypothetical protein